MKKTNKVISVALVLSLLLSASMFSIIANAAYENTYINTGDYRTDIIGVAKTQIGYREGSNNDTKYGTWYGLPNQPWCAMFISWCARQANVPVSILKNSAVAAPDAAYFNIPYEDGSVYTPKSGDLFFTKSFSHVGLVYYLDGDYFYTIEGNSNNNGSSEGIGVFSNKRKISDYYFGKPNYENEPIADDCSCSTSYAGEYTCTTSSYPLTIRSGHGTSYSSLGSIPSGATVTVTKASGTGSGDWAHVTYNGISGYASMECLKKIPEPTLASYPMPFYCRTISTEKVRCYNDINYSSSPGYIYPEDDCKITAIYSNGKVKCLCPWSDGTTKTVYVDSSVFFPSTPTLQKMTFGGYAKTYLRTTDSSEWGWTGNGEIIYILGTTSDMTQVIYPTSNGDYRCAWVYSSYLNSYTVSYNANGGSGAPSSQTKWYGVTLTLSSTKPTRTGYTFLGWSTSSSATSATYSAGGSFTTNANTTLYAVWKANTYTVSYNANGGSGAPSSQTKTHDVTLTLSSTKPTRSGYTFLGWATSSTATSATYSAGGSFTTNANTTLYAVWKANTYTVSYNANGGSWAPPSQTKTHGVMLTLSSTKPTRTGYTFLGWATSSTATSATYQPDDSFTTNANTTLYAVWKKNVTLGDINGDGVVDAGDAVLISRYDAGLVTLTSAQLQAGDVNGDGFVDAGDAVIISRYDAGFISSLS